MAKADTSPLPPPSGRGNSRGAFATGSHRKADCFHSSPRAKSTGAIKMGVELSSAPCKCAFFAFMCNLELCSPLNYVKQGEHRYPVFSVLYRLYILHSSRTTTRVAAWALSSHSVSLYIHKVACSCFGQDQHMGASLSFWHSLAKLM